MALIRWEPAPRDQLSAGEMNRLFNTFFDTPPTAPRPAAAGFRRWTSSRLATVSSCGLTSRA